jgi:outer membrane protein OmpA-like peptidoglycan-associated protein
MKLWMTRANVVAALVLFSVTATPNALADTNSHPLAEASAADLISALKPRDEALTYRGVPERTTRGLSFEAAAESGEQTASAPADLPTVRLNVPFAFDSAALTPKAEAMLREVGKAMQSSELSPYRFLLEGHTDTVGSEAYNKSLSERRARAVRRFLAAEMDVPSAKLVARGHGERFPLDPANPESAANRRVEIVNIGS